MTETKGTVAILTERSTALDSVACSGSLLSATKVLTYAHCIASDEPLDTATVRVGSLTWNEGGTLHQVSQKVVNDDIAILTLATPATGADTVELTPHETKVGHTVEIRGFGLQDSTQSENRPHALKKASARVISTSSGTSTWGPHNWSESFGEDAGTAWYGDLGGPQFNSIGQQVGVVRASELPAGQYVQASATLPHYLEWIIREARLS